MVERERVGRWGKGSVTGGRENNVRDQTSGCFCDIFFLVKRFGDISDNDALTSQWLNFLFPFKSVESMQYVK